MAEYIKRDDAINLLWLFADEACASVVSDFETLPAADVQPVMHGHWYFAEDAVFRCSVLLLRRENGRWRKCG